MSDQNTTKDVADERGINMEKNKLQKEMEQLIDQAIAGDQAALERLLAGVQDMVFNFSLRMLGTIPDAEDASQEILIKVMTHLSAFRRESSFSTWVFRIAANHLKDYRKNMFSKFPLSFEFYGEDIASGKEKDVPDLSQGIEQAMLEEELKMSCTNVMLQCLDQESRCIFILGTMFQVDSRVAAEILGTTPEAYRKRLSRVREKMAAFMGEYCGLSGTGMCSCRKRINYAIASHRLNPMNLEYSVLSQGADEVVRQTKNAMEKVDDLTFVYSGMPFYRASEKAKDWMENFLKSETFRKIAEA